MQVAGCPARVASPVGVPACARAGRARALPRARRTAVQRGNLGLMCSSVGPVVGAVTFPSGVTAKPMTSLSSALDAWRLLKGHAECANEIPHLRELMADTKRCEKLFASHDGITLDFSRQRVTARTMQLLFRLAEETKVAEKIEAMFAGQHLNTTEDRAVLHVALRSAKTDTFYDEGKNVVPEVHAVLDKIRIFSEAVRNGTYRGATGKPLTEVVAIGIGGSFLGPAFVHTALETDPTAQVSAAGRTLSFLANVDPEDVSRALKGKNPETTLVVVVSKTFTTAETMLNARTVRQWITESLGPEAVRKHMVAVSTNLDAVAKFGLDPANSFGFWDWVGGRYSVTSAVGILPLALQYGYPQMERFLAGARSLDRHFASAPLKDNLPVLMGLLGVWNTTFLGCESSAILPYCQALSKLAPHIQQVSMESNGKGVALDGTPLNFQAGEVIFGEPGTNGQHSFYQLIHQGRLVPVEFVGAALGQQAVYLDGEVVSNHDELMSNYFAQADALAYGKTPDELRAEGVPESLVPHKTFSGNRPSLSMLLPCIGAYQVGQILSLYENKIAVQGFVWGINSFDQWGVELGKVLAGRVRSTLSSVRKDKKPMEEVLPAAGFNYSTTRMMMEYLGHIQTLREGLAYSDVFKSPFDGFCTTPDSCAVYEDEPRG